MEILACCDIIPEAAEKFAGEFGVQKKFKNYKDLLGEDLDAVVVATPPFAHEGPVIGAVRAGKHVLCEKPLARTSEQAREIVETTKEAKGFSCRRCACVFGRNGPG